MATKPALTPNDFERIRSQFDTVVSGAPLYGERPSVHELVVWAACLLEKTVYEDIQEGITGTQDEILLELMLRLENMFELHQLVELNMN